jgi:hypothetical protein
MNSNERRNEIMSAMMLWVAGEGLLHEFLAQALASVVISADGGEIDMNNEMEGIARRAMHLLQFQDQLWDGLLPGSIMGADTTWENIQDEFNDMLNNDRPLNGQTVATVVTLLEGSTGSYIDKVEELTAFLIENNLMKPVVRGQAVGKSISDALLHFNFENFGAKGVKIASVQRDDDSPFDLTIRLTNGQVVGIDMEVSS